MSSWSKKKPAAADDDDDEAVPPPPPVLIPPEVEPGELAGAEPLSPSSRKAAAKAAKAAAKAKSKAKAKEPEPVAAAPEEEEEKKEEPAPKEPEAEAADEEKTEDEEKPKAKAKAKAKSKAPSKEEKEARKKEREEAKVAKAKVKAEKAEAKAAKAKEKAEKKASAPPTEKKRKARDLTHGLDPIDYPFTADSHRLPEKQAVLKEWLWKFMNLEPTKRRGTEVSGVELHMTGQVISHLADINQHFGEISKNVKKFVDSDPVIGEEKKEKKVTFTEDGLAYARRKYNEGEEKTTKRKADESGLEVTVEVTDERVVATKKKAKKAPVVAAAADQDATETTQAD